MSGTMRGVAVHEAGHAAVAHAVGLELVEVAIVRSHAGAGRCTAIRPSGCEPVDMLAVYRAGWIAEKALECGFAEPTATFGEWFADSIMRPLPPPDPSAAPLPSDAAKVQALGPTDAQAEAARRKALDIIVEHWPGIIALADRLLEVGTVSGEEAKKVLATFGVQAPSKTQPKPLSRATVARKARTSPVVVRAMRDRLPRFLDGRFHPDAVDILLQYGNGSRGRLA